MKMFPYNYHTHTFRCGHANGSDEDYILSAIKAGYRTLGFSDHVPYREYSCPRNRMDWNQLDEYFESLHLLKEKYKGQIDILIGMECEYYPECIDDYKMIKERADYLLLGQHFSTPDFKEICYFRNLSEEEIDGYTDSVVEAIHSGLYTYICHPDVFMNRQEAFTPACEKAAHLIGKACEEEKLPVELNIRGVMKGKKPFPEGEMYWYPHKNFWKILAQYDLKTVVGIDAHDPNELLDLKAVEDGLMELSDLPLHFIEEPFIHSR